jgi:L-ascorbate metabolism protein UlaG (beta-lactamase superfamily)
MRTNRRRFLGYALAASALATGLGATWLSRSNSQRARWLRIVLSDSRRAVTPARFKPSPANWPDNQITLCWVGHATVLINFYGLNILTDPVFGARVGLDAGIGVIGPKRYIASALSREELPPVDLLLLSHAHMDHMDLPSLRRLPHDTPTVTSKDTADILQKTRLRRTSELGWNEKHTLRCKTGDVEITAIEVKHWGRRWPNDRDRGYNGYILRREGKAILFGGDTGYTPLFREWRRHGPFQAAIMPIAAYNPWIRNHCTPEQAVDMATQAGAKFIVPIHHATFRLSDEPMDEPIQRFKVALQAESERIALRDVGESFACPEV